MRQTLLIVNLYVPRPLHWMKWKQELWRRRRRWPPSIAHFCVQTNSNYLQSLQYVSYVGRQSGYIATQKLVVLVKLQATKSSQLLNCGERPTRRMHPQLKDDNVTTSWWTPYEVPTQYTEIHLLTKQNCMFHLSALQQNNKRSPPTSRTCMPACSHQTISM